MAKPNEQQFKFVQEYLIDLDPQAAAIRAGYSAKTAHTIASELLRKPHIAALLKEEQAKYRQKSWISKDRIVEELATIAFFDIRELYGEDNKLIDVKKLPRQTAAAISSIKRNEVKGYIVAEEIITGEVIEVRANDKIKAIAELAKLMGFYEPIKTDGTQTMTVVFK